MVSTTKKSVAKMPLAWAARNCFQVGPPRGAGPRPWRRSTRRIELAEMRTPEPAKLALNANTSPAAVLPVETDDELDDLIAERGTSRASQGSPSLPLATRELPVPAQQGLGRDEEAPPPPSREQPAERREDRSVRGPVADAAVELPLQHADLVAEHHQLDVLVQSCPPAGSQQTEDLAHDEVAEVDGHGR